MTHSALQTSYIGRLRMILVFGSINVDLMVPIARLPRPGETILGADYALAPGGKGANQALAARRAGAKVMLAGAVGPDAFAGIALGLIRSSTVDTHLVRTVEQPTGCAAIMVSAAGENMIAVAPGANARLRSDDIPDELLGADTILVAQAEVPLGETATVIRRVRGRGGRCVFNLAPALPIDPALFSQIDLLVANRGEAATIAPDPLPLAGRLRRALVVTRGAAGSIAYLANGSRLEIPALSIAPVDTTGAGDTFVGVLAAGLDLGMSLELALLRASAAAGLSCLGRGAQSAMPDSTAIDAATSRLQAG